MNLVLIDEENRRYFKQQEITLFRRKGKMSLRDQKNTNANPLYFLVDDGYPPDDEVVKQA